MGLKDVGLNVLGAALDAADKAKAAVDKAIPQEAKDTAAKIKKKVDDSGLQQNIEKTVQGTVETAKSAVKVFVPSKIKTVDSSDVPNDSISTLGALTILYYLVAADGRIDENELAQFDLIYEEIDPEHTVEKEKVIRDCSARLLNADTNDYYDLIEDGVDKAIFLMRTPTSPITPKALVWDMFLIAYSDGEYAESEQKLIKYVVRKYDIDKALLLEMEHTMFTVADIDRELDWIKTQDRPYLEIEKTVNELNIRKYEIFKSVQALVTL